LKYGFLGWRLYREISLSENLSEESVGLTEIERQDEIEAIPYIQPPEERAPKQNFYGLTPQNLDYAVWGVLLCLWLLTVVPIINRIRSLPKIYQAALPTRR